MSQKSLWQLVFSDGSDELTSARSKEEAKNLGQRRARVQNLQLQEVKPWTIATSHRPAVKREPVEES